MEDFLPVLVEMRKGLTEKCARLTPTSSLKEQEDYLNSLYHYKKIFTKFCESHNEDLYKATDKAYKNVRSLQEGKPYEELITR